MRTLKYVGAAVAVLVLAALATTYGVLRGSLARLDGKLRVAGLAAPVRIERDSRGVPTIEAANRLDLAFATGFVHAQDRFFQMDLSRRLAAGELAELFGPNALAQDRKVRVFRFRALAREVLDVRGGPPPAPASGVALRAGAAGSNSWAVAGPLTATGAALVANDMHLGQRVPTLWYHARLMLVPGRGSTPVDLNGVTLPGAPVLVAGSNGHIAWGFTNSNGTWLGVSRLPCTAGGPRALPGGTGTVPPPVVWAEIRVRGEAPVALEVKTAAEGVLLRADEAEHGCWFGSWLAQQPAATNLGLMALEE